MNLFLAYIMCLLYVNTRQSTSSQQRLLVSNSPQDYCIFSFQYRFIMPYGISCLHPSAVIFLVLCHALGNTVQLMKVLSSLLCLNGKDRSSLLIHGLLFDLSLIVTADSYVAVAALYFSQRKRCFLPPEPA
jgi:hypothetical protein